MEQGTVDQLARTLATPGSRRRVAGLVVGPSRAGLLGSTDEAAAKRQHGRNRAHRLGRRKDHRRGRGRDTGLRDGPTGCGSLLQARGCTSDDGIRWIYPKNTDLRGIDFSGCDFRGSSFSQCLLDYANVTDVDLSRASISHSTAKHAISTRTNLTNTSMVSASFAGADVTGAIVPETYCPMGKLSAVLSAGTAESCCKQYIDGPPTGACSSVTA